MLSRDASKLLGLCVVFFVLDTTVLISFEAILPDPKSLTTGVQLTRTAKAGKKFQFVAGPKNKKYVPLNQIPQHLQSAVVTLEDSKFYQHQGFDFEEILNALFKSFERGKRLRGASTLSQQLVKNLYLSPERTFRRKILEALITIKVEATLPKRKILEIYLNSIDWGRGLLGIQEASYFYFKKPPRDLNLRESVFLASIIPNPARFGKLDEDQTPKLFVRRQMMKALQAMFRSGMITMEEFQDAIATPPPPSLIPTEEQFELKDDGF